jgi:hypothetical protein
MKWKINSNCERKIRISAHRNRWYVYEPLSFEADLAVTQILSGWTELEIMSNEKNPWSESANELYRPSDLHLSAKIVPTSEDRGYHVVSAADPLRL